jgi:hypothetical protein
MAKKSGTKGIVAEEALRIFFLQAGYFVVRNVPFNYKNCNVTDVDLWLYIRPSSMVRERTCVDVKSKRIPQAMERVFWTKGLREALGVERAIVVTSDNRKETRDFGTENGVTVLHGNFLTRVIKEFSPAERMTEEEFIGVLKIPCIVDSNVEWRRWYRGMKANLINGLNFDGCNTFLSAIKLIFDEYTSTGKASETTTRLLYVIFSYFLICLDFISRSIVSLSAEERNTYLTDGLRYGETGRYRTEEVVDIALHLLAESGKTDLFSQDELKGEFDRQVAEYRTEIIAEHFAKSEQLKHMFDLARRFEIQAYSKMLVQPNQCSSDQKAVIGLLCDFFGYDRRNII